MLRTLERSSLVIVLVCLVGLGAWIGSSDSRLHRAVEQQDERIDRTNEKVDLHERALVDHTVSIESNREAIERNAVGIEEHRARIDGLVAAGTTRDGQLETLRGRAAALEEQLAAVESGNAAETSRAERMTAELEGLRAQLRNLERMRIEDARQVSELQDRLDAMERDRDADDARLRAIEKALGIDPEP